MAEVPFGNGSYSHELWIRGGQLFTNPVGVDVESVNAGQRGQSAQRDTEPTWGGQVGTYLPWASMTAV